MLITCRSIFSILCGNKLAADFILLTHLLVCYNTDHLQHPQRVKNTQTEIPKGIKNTATTRSVPGVSKTISLYSLIALQLDDQDMIFFFTATLLFTTSIKSRILIRQMQTWTAELVQLVKNVY